MAATARASTATVRRAVRERSFMWTPQWIAGTRGSFYAVWESPSSGTDSRNTASRVSIQDFSIADRTVLLERVDAVTMVWDSAAHQWLLQNGNRRGCCISIRKTFARNRKSRMK